MNTRDNPKQVHQFVLPPHLLNQDGKTRRAGFEFEFTGVNLKNVASIVATRFGGNIAPRTNFEISVTESEYGDFTVEVDADIIKKRAWEGALEALGIDLTNDELESINSIMLRIASLGVPFEIVTPPLPIDNLTKLELLTEDLRKHNALGTKASFLFNFGLHINPEAPSLTCESILAHIRAFLLLCDWLKQKIDVDLTRRIAPFIDDFPEAYIKLVLAPDYAPDLETLIKDYLEHNPTRNRPLDMLPLFAAALPDSINHADVEHNLVKARPAYHYRLPDCRIDEPDWSVAAEWNRWVEVERLAADPDRLKKLCEKYLESNNEPISEWLTSLSEWLTVQS